MFKYLLLKNILFSEGVSRLFILNVDKASSFKGVNLIGLCCCPLYTFIFVYDVKFVMVLVDSGGHGLLS